SSEPTLEQLTRFFYLDDVDRALIMQRRGAVTQLGFALQVVTVRFLGTFLDDPLDVPPGVVAYLARQLNLPDLDGVERYRTSTVRRTHAAEIRQAYGYRQYGDQPGHFQLLRWLYARAWVGTERPSLLFERAVAWLRERKILLPGVTVLEREV